MKRGGEKQKRPSRKAAATRAGKQRLGGLFGPGADYGAHEDEAGKGIEFVDGEEFFGAHFVHVGGEGDGADEADPEKDADGSAAAGGVGVAPDADLGERVGDEQI